MAVRKIKETWWVDFRFSHTRYRKRSPENSRPGALAYEATLKYTLGRGEQMGLFRCAEHDRQLGGESPPSKPDGGEGLAKRKGVVARRGDQGERGSAKHAPGAEPGSRDPGAGPRRPRGTGWPRTVDRIWSKLPIFGEAEAEAEGLIGSQPWFSSYSWPRPSWRCTGRGDGRPTGPPARPRRRPYLPGPF
jgi:hypothetical protein